MNPFVSQTPQAPLDPDRWDWLVSAGMSLAEYPYQCESDRFNSARAILREAVVKFPEGPITQDMAVHSLVRGLIEVLISARPID